VILPQADEDSSPPVHRVQSGAPDTADAGHHASHARPEITKPVTSRAATTEPATPEPGTNGRKPISHVLRFVDGATDPDEAAKAEIDRLVGQSMRQGPFAVHVTGHDTAVVEGLRHFGKALGQGHARAGNVADIVRQSVAARLAQLQAASGQGLILEDSPSPQSRAAASILPEPRSRWRRPP
jgi:hypothetical protein